MRFPDAVQVTTVDFAAGTAIANVALVLLLRDPSKNNYYIGPLISDDDGNVTFTRDLCEKAIAQAQKMFVMDYTGDLQSCGSVIEVHLHPPEYIAGMLNNYRSCPQFWGMAFNEPEKLFSALPRVRNSEYELARLAVDEQHLLHHPNLTLRLKRRERT